MRVGADMVKDSSSFTEYLMVVNDHRDNDILLSLACD